VSVQPTNPLLAGFGVVGIGLLLALASDVAVTVLTPAKGAFLLGGFALLIPTMVLKDPKAYWLFLLVLTIPFDISKWLSDPLFTQTLVDTYGMPASGTVSIEIFLTDVVLVTMLLPWLAGVCLRREKLYFPKIGYLFVFYLGWAMLVSLINSESFYWSMFEFFRQVLYLLLFVYLINNVTTRLHLRSAVCAVFLGLIIGAGSVIVFFERGIGTDTVAFAGLHDQAPANAQPQTQTHKSKDSAPPPSLTLHIEEHSLGSNDHGPGSSIKRSQGMFGHPAIPASLCGLTLPMVLAYLIAARTNRDRIFFAMVYAWGFVALLLTFSRGGLIGFIVGTLVFFVLGGWSRLISRRVLKIGAVTVTLGVALSIPLLAIYLNTRPESFFMRFTLFEAALRGYWHHPILGVGLNNGTAAMKAGKQESKEMGIPIPSAESTDSLYLSLLTEVGPLGLILFVVFFGKIVMIALRATREAAADVKPLLVGMVAGVASLATQSLADEPMAGHAVSGVLWVFAALIIVIARRIQAETRASSPVGHAEPIRTYLRSTAS
jgi:hypothetical protein